MNVPPKEDIAKIVADIAFRTEGMKLSDYQRLLLQLFIEDMVLPNNLTEYSESTLEGYILKAMK